jgi:tRNA pseudouridine55 synthase
MNSRQSDAPSGLIILNKRARITSFDSLAEIKRTLGTGKVGHTGTLDKFAEGILLVLTGRALKLSPWFSGCDKRYEAAVLFGIETDTLDPEGATVAEAAPPSLNALERALPQFMGSIAQAPPEYSAIRIIGKRASALARSGQTIEMKKGTVHIYRLELLDWQPPLARIAVHCSGGTYIRSLARDIALAVGSRAHLRALCRTQVAGFKLGSGEWGAGSGDQGSGIRDQGSGSGERGVGSGGLSSLLPIDRNVFRLLGIPWFEITGAELPAVVQGKPLDGILSGRQLLGDGLYAPPGGMGRAVAVFCGDSLAAVIEKTPHSWKYGYVYAHS